jgi:hypothetical protein
MVDVSDQRDAALLQALGHKPAGIYSPQSEFAQARQKHRFHCECGYVSTYRATFAGAVEAGVIHMRKSAAAARSNGVSVPKKAGRTA